MDTFTAERSKVCKKCGETRILRDFSRDFGNKNITNFGEDDVCSVCRYRVNIRNTGYRAKRLGVESTLTLEQWLEIVKQQGGICACCRIRGNLLTVDHIAPMKSGGANSSENVQALCWNCNASKGNRHLTRY